MSLPMPRTELIALIAAMFACVAFSMDSMLPALPQMGAALSPDDPNAVGMVLTVFVLGLGLGTFFTGPLSDAFGRRAVILTGAALFIAASALAWRAQTLEIILLARLLQGLAAAAPRIVALAVLRDVFAGRAMAQVMSFVMMVFMVVPAIAPLLGSFVIAAAGWHGIFLSFMIFMGIIMAWVWLRLPETLAPAARRPFRAPVLWSALREMLAHPTVRLSILVQALSMGILFSMLTQVQRKEESSSIPLWTSSWRRILVRCQTTRCSNFYPSAKLHLVSLSGGRRCALSGGLASYASLIGSSSRKTNAETTSFNLPRKSGGI